MVEKKKNSKKQEIRGKKEKRKVRKIKETKHDTNPSMIREGSNSIQKPIQVKAGMGMGMGGGDYDIEH